MWVHVLLKTRPSIKVYKLLWGSLSSKLDNIWKISYAIFEILDRIPLVKSGAKTQTGLSNRGNILTDVTEKPVEGMVFGFRHG